MEIGALLERQIDIGLDRTRKGVEVAREGWLCEMASMVNEGTTISIGLLPLITPIKSTFGPGRTSRAISKD